MKPRLFIILIMFSATILSASSHAQTWETEFDFTSGQSETIDESDVTDLNYSFTKRYFRIGHALSPVWYYSLTINQGDRTYSEAGESFDNANLKIRNSIQNTTEDDEKRMTSDYDIYWENKTFEDLEASTYNKTYAGVRNTYKEKKSHLIGWTSGLTNFLYPRSHRKPENLADFKILFERYLQENTLTLDGYSRFMSSTRAIFGNQFMSKIGLTKDLDLPHLKEIQGDFRFGARNSRVDDESIDSDFDYDYHFTELSVSSGHPINEDLDMTPSYDTSTRKYISASYDNSGWGAGLAFEWRPMKNLTVKPSYKYSEKFYSLVTSLSNYKNAYSLKTTYRIRGDWGVVSRFSQTYYEFLEGDVKDRSEFYMSVDLNKYFTEKLNVTLSGEYRFKDYEIQWDLRLSTWKIGASYTW